MGAHTPPQENSRRAPQDRVGPPQLPDLLLQLLDAPGPLGGGAGPVAGVDPGLAHPAAQGLGALPQPLRPRAANTPQADPGRPRHPGVNRTARRPRSSGYFLGAGTTPHPFHEFKPSTTPRAIQADKLLTATYPWLLTYDDQEIIWANLYNAARCARFNIAHTAAIQHVGKETIVYGPTLTVPTGLEITPGVHATWIA